MGVPRAGQGLSVIKVREREREREDKIIVIGSEGIGDGREETY